MTEWFADTFYFLALLNARDPWHARALEASRRFAGRFVTTYWVINEVGNGVAGSRIRVAVPRLVKQLREDARTEIVPLGIDVLDRGLALYAERSDKEWSLTDCIPFIVMQDRGIREALTGDHHFEQAGFVALLK